MQLTCLPFQSISRFAFLACWLNNNNIGRMSYNSFDYY